MNEYFTTKFAELEALRETVDTLENKLKALGHVVAFADRPLVAEAVFSLSRVRDCLWELDKRLEVECDRQEACTTLEPRPHPYRRGGRKEREEG